MSAGKNRSGNEYTNETLYTFPRYNVLKAILVEIERHRPVDFTSLDEAKRAFKAVAAKAFQDTYFDPEVGTETLRTILRTHGIQTLWEMLWLPTLAALIFARVQIVACRIRYANPQDIRRCKAMQKRAPKLKSYKNENA